MVDETEARRFRLRLMALHRRLRAEHVQDAPLNQILVLGAVDRLGGRVAPARVADELKMARSNVSAMLRQLEAKKWVVTEASPQDARRKTVALSDAGRAVLARDRVGREAWLRRTAAAVLSAEEQSVLIRAGELMQRLAEAAPADDDPARPA